MEGYSNWHGYGADQWYERGVAADGSGRQEYRQLIHDLSKKLSHDNVQSISFLRRSSVDCCSAAGGHCSCPMAACAAQPPPTNHGLQLLEHLWHKGEFSETNLEPLVQLLRDIDRHDLADECREKSSKLYSNSGRDHRQYCQYAKRGEQLNRAVTQNLFHPRPIPPTLLPSSPLDSYRDSSEAVNDKAKPSEGNQSSSGGSPAIERNSSFSSETEMTQNLHHHGSSIGTTPQPIDALSAHSAPPPAGPMDGPSMPRPNSRICRSIPTQTCLNSAPQLSTTAPDLRQLDLEASISVHFNKDELHKLLQCSSDPELKEKLMTAYQRGYFGGGCSHHDREGEKGGIMSGEAVPKVVMNSGQKMSSEASDFNSSTQDHLHTNKVLLRRQSSLLHVRNIETPIPAPLTPQPQKTHMKLEARSSNTSTASSDSGLSQCKSHRSSTVSNASSSDAFLSEEEEKEDDPCQSTQQAAASTSACPQRKDSGVGSTRRQQTVVASGNDEHTCSRNDRLKVAKKLERERSHSDHKVGGAGSSLVKKQQLDDGVGGRRRQSDSTKEAMAAERRDKHDSARKGRHHISRKRYRAVSLPEFPPPNPLAKTGMTIDWRIPRDDFIDPIFHHKNKIFERKCRFSTGSGSSILNVQLAIRLYPNGINWDQGSYSTLIVEITNTSRPPPHTAYIQFEIAGYDCHAGHVIASRQVEYPLKHKEFLIPEFLSHEVIKVSHARNFEFRATIKIKYLVCSDWVVIPPDQESRYSDPVNV